MSDIWIKPYDLNLEKIKRDKEGNIVSGWVINGGWFFEIKDGEMLCREKAGGRIVTRWPHTEPVTEYSAPEYK